MDRITPYTEIESFENIAKDFNELLIRDDNQDIVAEFPWVSKYSMGIDKTIDNFENTRDLCKPGEREQFIISFGEKAVGLGLINNQQDSPPGIDDSWPNISGYIMNPYRGRGLGRFSIEHRMKIIEQNFGNHAWTLVRDDNVRSEHLVSSVGFEKTYQKVEGWENHNLFVYDGNSS